MKAQFPGWSRKQDKLQKNEFDRKPWIGGQLYEINANLQCDQVCCDYSVEISGLLLTEISIYISPVNHPWFRCAWRCERRHPAPASWPSPQLSKNNCFWGKANPEFCWWEISMSFWTQKDRNRGISAQQAHELTKNRKSGCRADLFCSQIWDSLWTNRAEGISRVTNNWTCACGCRIRSIWTCGCPVTSVVSVFNNHGHAVMPVRGEGTME